MGDHGRLIVAGKALMSPFVVIKALKVLEIVDGIWQGGGFVNIEVLVLDSTD